MFSIARTNAKTPRDLREGMRLVKECLRIIWECQYDLPQNSLNPNLKFWVIENPATGLLRHFLGNPTYTYSPDEFGADWTKRTALWGKFNPPPKPFFLRNKLVGKSVQDVFTPMNMPDKYDRMNARSNCYIEFAKAFFEANQ